MCTLKAIRIYWVTERYKEKIDSPRAFVTSQNFNGVSGCGCGTGRHAWLRWLLGWWAITTSASPLAFECNPGPHVFQRLRHTCLPREHALLCGTSGGRACKRKCWRHSAIVHVCAVPPPPLPSLSSPPPQPPLSTPQEGRPSPGSPKTKSISVTWWFFCTLLCHVATRVCRVPCCPHSLWRTQSSYSVVLHTTTTVGEVVFYPEKGVGNNCAQSCTQTCKPSVNFC